MEAFNQLPTLHKNIKVVVLPELEWAKKWKVRIMDSNNKEVLEYDINGKALPIEMYFWKLFENEFTDDEKVFEKNQCVALPDNIKSKLQEKILGLHGDEEMFDGKKIIDFIQSIDFS